MDINHDEFGFINFSGSLFVFVSSFMLIYFFFFLRRGYDDETKTGKSPPSPPKLPLIGHLHHFLRGELPHRALTRISKKYGPVIHLQIGEVPVVVISSREAAEQVLKVQDPSCADRPDSIAMKIMWYDYTDIVFSPYNEYWWQMCKICVSELLSVKNVKSFEYIRQDEVSCLIKSLEESSLSTPIDLTEKVFKLMSSMTCRAAFGKVMKDRDLLLAMMKKAIDMTAGFEVEDLFPSFKLLNLLSWNKHKLLRMRRKVDVILNEVLDEHRVKQRGELGGEDMVDALLRMQRSGQLQSPITDDNMKAVIFDMFAAGTETLASTIDWAMAQLMRNPHVMAKVQAEVRQAFKERMVVDESDIQKLKYLKLVIKETLRLHPPALLLPRACRDECTVEGYSIPLKSRVLVNIWSMRRDPRYWEDPECFIPERFENSSIDFLGNNFEYLPFGAGRRSCPGMNYGLASVELPLARLLYHFDWKLPDGKTHNHVDMSEAPGLTTSRRNGLLLVPTVVYKSSMEASSHLYKQSSLAS